jgi:hypothetical protein
VNTPPGAISGLTATRSGDRILVQWSSNSTDPSVSFSVDGCYNTLLPGTKIPYFGCDELSNPSSLGQMCQGRQAQTWDSQEFRRIITGSLCLPLVSQTQSCWVLNSQRPVVVSIVDARCPARLLGGASPRTIELVQRTSKHFFEPSKWTVRLHG